MATHNVLSGGMAGVALFIAGNINEILQSAQEKRAKNIFLNDVCFGGGL